VLDCNLGKDGRGSLALGLCDFGLFTHASLSATAKRFRPKARVAAPWRYPGKELNWFGNRNAVASKVKSVFWDSEVAAGKQS